MIRTDHKNGTLFTVKFRRFSAVQLVYKTSEKVIFFAAKFPNTSKNEAKQRRELCSANFAEKISLEKTKKQQKIY